MDEEIECYVTLRNIGTSYIVTVPKKIVKLLGLQKGDALRLRISKIER